MQVTSNNLHQCKMCCYVSRLVSEYRLQCLYSVDVGVDSDITYSNSYTKSEVSNSAASVGLTGRNELVGGQHSFYRIK